MGEADEEITAFLEALGAGEDAALGELFSTAYVKLRSLAQAQRRRWRGGEALSTTTLVHEAYLKLSRQESPQWRDRGHFFAAAARAMRHILINSAKRGRAAKRGGGAVHVAAEETPLIDAELTEELLALNEALDRLEDLSPRQVRVVECRFFAGLGIEETAEALTVSPATVKRDWHHARAWLYRELRPDAATVDDPARPLP